METVNGISVVVCCYNSVGRIKPTLEHLLNQKISSTILWEIIIVDNNSTDNTASFCKELLEGSKIAYSIVLEKRQGLSFARKTGYDTAQYNLLLFVDDDNWLADNYIQTTYSIMNEYSDIAILGGKGSPVFSESTIVPEWFQAFQQSYAVGAQSDNTSIDLQYVPLVYGAGFIIRKAYWEKLFEIGFESLLPDRKGKSLLSGGDTELCLAIAMLGGKILYSSNLTFKHFIPKNRLTWEYLSKLYFGFGRAKIYIKIYLDIENDKGNPQHNLKFPFWFDRSIHLCKEIIAFKTNHHLWLYKRKNRIGDVDYLRLQGLQGELFELVSIRRKITDKYNQVIQLKERIKRKN